MPNIREPLGRILLVLSAIGILIWFISICIFLVPLSSEEAHSYDASWVWWWFVTILASFLTSILLFYFSGSGVLNFIRKSAHWVATGDFR